MPGRRKPIPSNLNQPLRKSARLLARNAPQNSEASLESDPFSSSISRDGAGESSSNEGAPRKKPRLGDPKPELEESALRAEISDFKTSLESLKRDSVLLTGPKESQAGHESPPLENRPNVGLGSEAPWQKVSQEDADLMAINEKIMQEKLDALQARVEAMDGLLDQAFHPLSLTTVLQRDNDYLRDRLLKAEQELHNLRQVVNSHDCSKIQPVVTESSFTIVDGNSKHLAIDQEGGTLYLPLENLTLGFKLADVERVFFCRHREEPLIGIGIDFNPENPKSAPGCHIERYRVLYPDEPGNLDLIRKFFDRLTGVLDMEDEDDTTESDNNLADGSVGDYVELEGIPRIPREPERKGSVENTEMED